MQRETIRKRNSEIYSGHNTYIIIYYLRYIMYTFYEGAKSVQIKFRFAQDARRHDSNPVITAPQLFYQTTACTNARILDYV